MRRTTFARIAVGAPMVFVLAVASPGLAATGEMVDLGTLGGDFSAAVDVNESGDVVGNSDTSNNAPHGFFWTAKEGLVDVGTLGGIRTDVWDLNEHGEVVGNSFTVAGLDGIHAFIWSLDGGMVDLGTLGGAHSGAHAINDAGQVVGSAQTANGRYHAFVWSSSTGMIDLGTLGGIESRGWDIDEAGQVTGLSFTADGEEHAFFWSAKIGMVDLGTLGGDSSEPFDIGESGQVVGRSETAGGETRPFLWTYNGGMKDLGTFGGGSNAMAVNSSGQIAGWSEAPHPTYDFTPHAFVWTTEDGMVDIHEPGYFTSSPTVEGISEAGQVVGSRKEFPASESVAFSWTKAEGIVDLGTLGGSFSYANAVNEEGQIVGQAETNNGEGHAFVWYPATPPDTDSFVDDNDSIFEADIEWLAAEGITKGCNPPTNDRFCPEDFVTRGQMAAFLVRALGYSEDGGGDLFVDDDDSIFEGDIDRLGTAGVTKGCNPATNDRFCPTDFVTRGQMAAFLGRALGYTDDGGGNLFVDDDGSTFENDIDKLGTAGVTKGCNPPVNDRFCPNDFVTRGQMAAFLHRALGP